MYLIFGPLFLWKVSWQQLQFICFCVSYWGLWPSVLTLVLRGKWSVLPQTAIWYGFQECIVDINKDCLYCSSKWKWNKPAFEWTLKCNLQTNPRSGCKTSYCFQWNSGKSTKWDLIYCYLTDLCLWLFRVLIIFLCPVTKRTGGDRKSKNNLALSEFSINIELHWDQFNTFKYNRMLSIQKIFKQYFQAWVG